MNTHLLKLYTLSEDTLPVDGSTIAYFHQRRDWDVQLTSQLKYGEVLYMYGDIADSLEEAIAKGGYIAIDGQDDDLAINIQLDNDVWIRRGCIWCYDHELYAITNPMLFPFQTIPALRVADQQGWCKILNSYDATPGRLPFVVTMFEVEYLGVVFKLKFFNDHLQERC